MSNQETATFKQFMAEYWPEYTQQGDSSEDIITYSYEDSGKKPSALTAFVLFLLGIIPGVIYLVVGGKKPEKHIVKALKKENALKIVEEKAKKVKKSYEAYIKDEEKFKIKRFKGDYNTIMFGLVLWVIIIVMFLIFALS
jgi:hypothetical protein